MKKELGEVGVSGSPEFGADSGSEAGHFEQRELEALYGSSSREVMTVGPAASPTPSGPTRGVGVKGTDNPSKLTLKKADRELTSAASRALNGATTAPISELVVSEDLIEAEEVLDYFKHPEKAAAEGVKKAVIHAVTPVATAVAGPVAGPVIAFIAGRLAGDLTERALGPAKQPAATGEAESVLQAAYDVLDHQRSGIGDLADNPSFVEFIGGLLATPLDKVIFEGGSAEARRDQERETDQPGLITVFLAAFEVITPETAGSATPVDPKAPLQPVSFAVLRCLPDEFS